ncbi:MAG: glycosyl hydrolase family 18 protein [Arachidicoccus sp.]|nr:glycosyl hydrolase family 18 protein [Arachidicoccus sp.]
MIGYISGNRIDISKIQFQYLTNINYAFAIPAADSSGNLLPLSGKDTIRALIDSAHAHHVQVSLSIGGWGIGDGGGNDTRYEVLANSETSRTKFTASVMQYLREFGFDGADIDWEYPDPIEPSEHNYVLLMKQLSDSLHSAGKILTAAIVSYHDVHGQGISNEVFTSLDWFNIMAYDDDYNSFDGNYVPHSPYWLAVESFDYWIDKRGMPKEKAVMGVPFYGKAYHGHGASYKELLARGANPKDDIFDSIYYNGITTMQRKTKLAKQRGAGIMIWELPEDTTGNLSLLKAIYDAAQ